MEYSNIYSQAQKTAMKAKPGILKLNGKVYTFVFDQKHWVYQVCEDGFEILRINTKKLSDAKKFLKDWLEN